jgi:hypothetical protein
MKRFSIILFLLMLCRTVSSDCVNPPPISNCQVLVDCAPQPKCTPPLACCNGTCYDPTCLSCSNGTLVAKCTDPCYPTCDPATGNCLPACTPSYFTNGCCSAGSFSSGNASSNAVCDGSSITFSASATPVPGSLRIVNIDHCCNQTITCPSDSIAGNGCSWGLYTYYWSWIAGGSGCSLTTNLPPGLYHCVFWVSATNTHCGVISTNLVATGTVYGASLWPTNFIVTVNDGDADNDAIPDYADGFDWDGINGNVDDTSAGVSFIPWSVTLDGPIDVSKAKVRLTYSNSDPAAVARPVTPLYYYTVPTGNLRIWKKDGNQSRNKNSANAGSNPGDFVPSDTYIDLTKLGFSESVKTVTLYVEGVLASANLNDQTIQVEVDPDGSGSPGWCSQTVHLTVVRAVVNVDSDNNGIITTRDDPIEAMSPGLIIPKDLEGDSSGEDVLKPVVLRMQPALNDGTITLSAGAGIKIWTDMTKTTEIMLPKSYSPPSTLPGTVYVDGIVRWANPDIELRCVDTNGVQIAYDKVKVLVTETPSWAPAKTVVAHVWSSLPALGEGDCDMFVDQIKDQGFPSVVWYRDATGNSDTDFMDCTIANYRAMPGCAIYTVDSHGEEGAHDAVYASDSAAGQAACDAWRGSEANMTTVEWPGNCYTVRVSSKWLAANWAGTANANRLIAMWSICYSATGNPGLGETSVKEAAGGRWRSGYINPTDENEARTLNQRFLGRMNGSTDNAQKRTAGEAWDSGSGYTSNAHNAQMDGNNWTTLCPSPMLQAQVFPTSDPGRTYGWGCIIFDTYMNNTIAAADALTKVQGCDTYDYQWRGTTHGKFILGFAYDKTSGAATTVQANADKCKNSDPDGGRQLDGDRVKPNGDPKQWSF